MCVCVCVDCLGRSLWMGQMEFCPFITKIGHGKYGTLAEGVMLEPAEGYQKSRREMELSGFGARILTSHPITYVSCLGDNN